MQNNRLKRYFGTALCALFPLILSLLVINPVMAAPVDKAAAKELAETFFATTPGMRVGNASSTLTLTGVILSNGSEQPALQYVKSTKNEAPEALIYIFERGAGNGFVLIAGDDRFEPYVAYSRKDALRWKALPSMCVTSLRSTRHGWSNFWRVAIMRCAGCTIELSARKRFFNRKARQKWQI